MIIPLLYFLIPAATANMAAALSAKVFPNWNFPLDFNKKYRGIRVFGDHKTVRGIVSGTICAVIIYYLQISLYNTPFFNKLSIINYHSTPYYLGLLLGLGALLGDAVKSFFKRQIGVKPGSSWIPFDQTDWVIGALLATFWLVPYDLPFIGTALLVILILHITVKYIGYKLKLDSAPL